MKPLCIINGSVLTTPGSPPQAADILVEGGRIQQVGGSVVPPRGAQVVDAQGCLVFPGLGNAHTPPHSVLGRATLDGWRLEQLLLLGGTVLGHRSAEDHYLGAALNAVEMLEAGCTSAYDMVTILPAADADASDAVVQAYADVGMRAVLAPSVADLPFTWSMPGLRELLPEDLRAEYDASRPGQAGSALRALDTFLDRYGSWADGRVRGAVAPSIPTQCSDELLEGCVGLAAKHGVGLHTHLAETRSQAVQAQRRWGTSLTQHLLDVGALEGPAVGAHGIWLSAPERDLLAATTTSVVHNPGSNAKLGSGTADVAALREAGVPVALGTDGSMTSDNQNLFEAMRMASYQSRSLRPDDRSRWLDAATCLEMATTAGGLAMGDGDLGHIRPGARADLTLLRTDAVETTPLNDPTNALVFASSGSGVATVVVDGEVVVAHGRAQRVDRTKLLDRAREAAERLTSEPGDEPSRRRLARLEAHVLDACARLVPPPSAATLEATTSVPAAD